MTVDNIWADDRYRRTLEEAPEKLSVKVIREQLGVYDAKEEELRYFAEVCHTLGLSPFAGQICLIGRRDRKLGRVVYRPQITVDGRRARAERTGLLDGIEGPVWCGPRENPDAPLVWEDVWTDDDQYPYCARVLVHRKDWSKPTNGTAKWLEFHQTVPGDRGETARLSPFWARMPSHMLGKVAESLALRRAFPNDISYQLAAAYVGDDTESALTEAVAQVTARPPRYEERVPDHVYDALPEANVGQPVTERYDPADPARPF